MRDTLTILSDNNSELAWLIRYLDRKLEGKHIGHITCFYDTDNIELYQVNSIIEIYNTFASRAGLDTTERIDSIEDIKCI